MRLDFLTKRQADRSHLTPPTTAQGQRWWPAAREPESRGQWGYTTAPGHLWLRARCYGRLGLQHAQGGGGMEELSAVLAVMTEMRRLVALPANDFTWSAWGDQRAALADMDRYITALQQGVVPPLSWLFAPTGPLQEVSLRSGWGAECLALAARFDAAMAHRTSQRTGPALQTAWWYGTGRGHGGRVCCRVQVHLGTMPALRVSSREVKKLQWPFSPELRSSLCPIHRLAFPLLIFHTPRQGRREQRQGTMGCPQRVYGA